MMKFLDDEGREGTGVGRKAVLRAHAPRPSMSGSESSVPDIGEWRRHMADAILADLAEVRERG